MDIDAGSRGDPALLVFTAKPGTEDHTKLQMLSVIGTQHLTPNQS